MGALLLLKMVQHGPNGGFTMLPSWFWVLIAIPVILAMIFLYKLVFPKLSKVQVTETLEDAVVKNTGDEPIITKVEGEDGDRERKSSVPSQEAPMDVALRLLESDERTIIEALIAADGSLLQKEISWKTGFSRVKTHRVLVRLIRRGVVTSEKYYNTNKITLSEWLRTPNP